MSPGPDVPPWPLSTFVFGPFELDSALLELRRGGRPVPIGPKALAFLQYLLVHRERVVSRAELFEKLWPGVRVGDAALRSVVHEARTALSDGDASGHRITTLHGRGYRLVADVKERRLADAAPTHQASPSPMLDFVDREAEFSLLRASLERARASERQVVLLHGPPGIGKTRTALEMGREAERAGFDVHVSRVQEDGGVPPYWPWIQLLRSWTSAHAGELDARTRAQLEAVLATPGESEASGALPSVKDADGARFRWFDAVTALLRRVCELRPMLLVLDDLHWADDASIRLLVFVVQQLPRARLLVLGTHRELPSSHLLGQVLREAGARSVRLSGLDRSFVEQLLERALRRPPGPALLERVYAASGGNPLFASELVRQLVGWRARAAATLPLPVGTRLRDAIWTRLSECSEGCLRVLRVASVAGSACTLPLLRRAVAGGPAELLEALGEAERRDLLRVSEGTHEFAHGLIREAIYEELGPAERMRLHEVVGVALEQLSGPDSSRHLAALAHHFGESMLSHPQRALEYARRAGLCAARAFAYREAIALYRVGLRALEHIQPYAPEQRCSLLIALGEAMQLAGEEREAFLAAFTEALDLARAADLPSLLGHAAERCVVHLSARGELLPYAQHRADPLLDQLRSALDHAVRRDPAPPDAEARLHAARAVVHCATQEQERGAEAIRRALHVGEATGNAALQAETLQQQSDLGLLFDAGCERLAYPARLLELARKSGREDLEVHARMAELLLCVERGDRDGAERAGDSVRRLQVDRSARAFGAAQSWRVLHALLDGHLDEAQRAMLAAIESAGRERIHGEWIAAAASTYIWWTCLLRGTVQAPMASLESYAVARPVEPVFPVFRILLARTYAELGRTEEASRSLCELGPRLAELPRSGLWLLCTTLVAETCALCSRPEHAELLLDLLRPYARRVAMVGDFMCLGSVSRPLGSLSALLGRWGEADIFFGHALSHARTLRAPILETIAQLDLGRALVRHPAHERRRRARDLAASASATARELGLTSIEQAGCMLQALVPSRQSRSPRPGLHLRVTLP